MNFPSTNHFCENIRNAAMMTNIDDFTEIVFQNKKEKYLQKKIERKIFDKNKDKLYFFYKIFNECKEKIYFAPFTVFERKEKFQEMFEEIIFNKTLLKKFPYFNNNFNEILLKLSGFDFWGSSLSLFYMSRYYS